MDQLELLFTDGVIPQFRELNELSEAGTVALDKLTAAVKRANDALGASTTGRGVNQAGAERVKAQQDLVTGIVAIEKAERAQQQSALAMERQHRANVKAVREESKANAELRNDYALLSKAFNDAALRFKNYALQLGDNHRLTLQAQKDAQDMGARLKQLDAGVGQYQRNVGNYSGAVAGLGFSLRNIAGELPNLAISMRTFGQAISNNIGPAIEAFKNLSAENAKLRAEGKSTTSTLGIIGRSFFSLASIIPLVITAGFAFVEYLRKQESAADRAEKANKKYQESLANVEEAERSTAMQEIAHIQVLASIASSTENSMKNRERAIRDLKKAYPDYFADLNNEIFLQGEAKTAIDAATSALLARAAASAAEKKFAAAGERVYELELAQREALDNLTTARKQYSKELAYENTLTTRQIELGKGNAAQQRGVLQQAQQGYEKITSQLGAARAEQLQFLRDGQRFASQSGNLLLTPDPKTPRAKRAPRQQDTTNEELKSGADFIKEQYKELSTAAELEAEKQKAIADNEEKTLDERLDAYTRYTNERVKVAGYALSAELDIVQQRLGKIAEIEARGAKTNEEKNLLLERETLLQRQENIVGQYQLAETKLLDDGEKFRRELRAKYADDELKAAKKLSDERLRIEKQEAKQYKDALKVRADAAKDFYKSLETLGRELFNTLQAFDDAEFEREQKGFDEEEERLKKTAENRILDIEQNVGDERERSRLIAEAKGELAAQEEDVDRKREISAKKREEAEKRFQAAEIAAQAVAIGAKLAIDAARLYSQAAVLAAFGNPQAIPVTAAAIFTTAQIGVVAGIATARIAQLYAYADGTDNHPGGDALVGEGGQPEWYKAPGQPGRWVKQAELIKDMPKGSKVIPLDKMVQWDMLTPSLMRSLQQSQGMGSGDVVAALGQLGRRIEKSNARNRPVVNIHGMSPGFRKQVRGSC